MKKEKGKTWLFSTVISLAVFLMAIASVFFSSRITIYTAEQKSSLASGMGDLLMEYAVSEAKKLDPDYQWLTYEEDIPEAAKKTIEENISTTLWHASTELSRDSNLAWLVDFQGKTYSQNWKEKYDELLDHQETPSDGALFLTITSKDGKIICTGEPHPDWPSVRSMNVLVNPNLVPEDRLNSASGSSYTVTYNLPDDFTIYFYVPSHIIPDGGQIAKIASGYQRLISPIILVTTLLLILLVLLWKWDQEKDFKPLKRLTKLKALPAWILVIGGLALLNVGVYSFTELLANGSMSTNFQMLGFGVHFSWILSLIAVWVCWTVYYGLVVLATLYVKFIAKKGLRAYLREDTLVSWLIRYGQNEVEELLIGEKEGTDVQILLVAIVVSLLCIVLIVGGVIFARLPGLIIAALICAAILFFFMLGVHKKIMKSYKIVSQKASEMAKGNFTQTEEKSAGIYQPIYDDLSQISESYSKALKEGLSSQISRTQLISNVSHDLKTPVAGIASYTELIAMSDDLDEIKGYSKRLQTYSARLSDLIQDLFDVARASNGDISLELVRIDLSELLRQVCAEWEDQLAERKLRLVLSLPEQAPVTLDPGITVRIIDNLFSNILKYSLPGTRVFVHLFENKGVYQLEFKNTSATELDFNPDQIVERFVRGDASRHEPGSGLGLAIVKSFVEVQQGTFEVQTDGDLFKALILFPIPPVPEVPELPDSDEPVKDEHTHPENPLTESSGLTEETTESSLPSTGSGDEASNSDS